MAFKIDDYSPARSSCEDFVCQAGSLSLARDVMLLSFPRSRSAPDDPRPLRASRAFSMSAIMDRDRQYPIAEMTVNESKESR